MRTPCLRQARRKDGLRRARCRRKRKGASLQCTTRDPICASRTPSAASAIRTASVAPNRCTTAADGGRPAGIRAAVQPSAVQLAEGSLRAFPADRTPETVIGSRLECPMPSSRRPAGRTRVDLPRRRGPPLDRPGRRDTHEEGLDGTRARPGGACLGGSSKLRCGLGASRSSSGLSTRFSVSGPRRPARFQERRRQTGFWTAIRVCL